METKDYIRHKAIIYQRYKDNFDELSLDQIDIFQREVSMAFRGLPVRVAFVDFDPYANLKQLSDDILVNGRMLISRANNDSKLLGPYINLKFRAVHDYLHYVLQAPFTAEGEIAVYKIQKKLHSSAIGQQILFSEVVLQACYAEYYGTEGKPAFAPVQKVVLYKGRI